ncbi:arylesterase [Lysobacter sp. GX 14042]|uniref:arylesterase n=1 Tax=Lysobacter sp. GX 14042 TaxID=2907155 RepID=UPI001F2D808E|nr:arylesterase [Lysobacter sp. GX 14042]MCE7033050.1 arylesterase [Lysobacter sp. GX 14042]
MLTALLAWAPSAAAQDRTSADAGPTVLVMGDSLSAGYGMTAAEGWVALLADRLATRTPRWNVVNASISGETTAGGRSRIIDALARHRPQVVVIALGANDGLRGLPTASTAANLAWMIGAAHGAHAEVLLVGMQMPPNLGAEYTRAFAGNYRTLADRFDVALLPFLLEPIALDPDAYQADNLHPLAAVQPRLLEHVWEALEPMLD